MGTPRIAVIGGDGIGPEVVEAGCRVLDTLASLDPALSFAFERHDWGSDYYKRHGVMMPADGLARLEGVDAIYFGAVGAPDLPDDITLPLLWLGLLLNLNGAFTSLQNAVIGATVGYLTLWGVYWAFKLTTGKEGMGFGDFKLLAAIGAWLGWTLLPLVILLSSAVGAVIGIALIVFTKHGRNIPIPFGPYLAGGGLIALFWGQTLTQNYLQLLAQ